MKIYEQQYNAIQKQTDLCYDMYARCCLKSQQGYPTKQNVTRFFGTG